MYYFMSISRHTLYHKLFNDGMNVLRIYSILFCCEKRMVLYTSGFGCSKG